MEISRSPVRGHDPHAGDRRGAEGRFGTSGSSPGSGADGLCPLATPPESQPARSEMARSRPVRAVGGAWLHAPLLSSALDRLRPDDGRPEGLSPVGEPYPRTPGMAPDAGRRGDDRASRTGDGQRDRHGDCGTCAGRALQSPGPRDRQPSHFRPRLRRRRDGGDLGGGLLARRAFEAGQADVPLRREPGHARRAGVPHLHRGRRTPLRGVRLAGPPCCRRKHRPARDP